MIVRPDQLNIYLKIIFFLFRIRKTILENTLDLKMQEEIP